MQRILSTLGLPIPPCAHVGVARVGNGCFGVIRTRNRHINSVPHHRCATKQRVRASSASCPQRPQRDSRRSITLAENVPERARFELAVPGQGVYLSRDSTHPRLWRCGDSNPEKTRGRVRSISNIRTLGAATLQLDSLRRPTGSLWVKLVEARGLEPLTSCLQSKCFTR